MTLILLLCCSCLGGPPPDEDIPPSDPSPTGKVEGDAADPASPELPVAEEAPFPRVPGSTWLCVDAPPGQAADAGSWVFMSGTTMAQIELGTVRGLDRCGLIQTLYLRSGLSLRAERPSPAGTVVGMHFVFPSGSIRSADYVHWTPGMDGVFYHVSFDPFEPPSAE